MRKMRRYLFRGKIRDGDEWYYGNLRIHYDENGQPITTIQTNILIVRKLAFEIRVDPDTVDQSIEINDRDNNTIFENDLIIFGTDIADDIKNSRVLKVVYENGSYLLRHGREKHYRCWIDPENAKRMKIIGNYHDNPEYYDPT